MGFPIPYAGILPKLLFTAAISMAAIRDLCISLLESLGIIIMGPSHHYSISNQLNHTINDSASIINDYYPSHWYSNPHLHSPADHPLFIRRSAFVEAVQASLPAVLYENLPLNCLAQEFDADTLRSSPSSSSQEFDADTLRSLPSSSSLANSSSLSSSTALSPSSSSPLCSTASHDELPKSEQTPEGVVATADINLRKPMMSARSSAAAYGAMAHTSQYDQLQERRPPAPTLLSLPYSCDATASSSHADHRLQRRAMTYELQKQVPAVQTAISACVQEEVAGSSCVGHHAQCAVCLCEFERGEEVRELPSCRHIFHKDCIDGWLFHNHRTCPLCRSSLLTPAIELQERMREQELSDQLTSWFNSLQQEEGAAYQDHYVQQYLHIDDHDQDLYYTLQPAGNF